MSLPAAAPGDSASQLQNGTSPIENPDSVLLEEGKEDGTVTSDLIEEPRSGGSHAVREEEEASGLSPQLRYLANMDDEEEYSNGVLVNESKESDSDTDTLVEEPHSAGDQVISGENRDGVPPTLEDPPNTDGQEVISANISGSPTSSITNDETGGSEIKQVKDTVKKMRIDLSSLKQEAVERRIRNVMMQQSADKLVINFRQMVKTNKALQRRLEALEVKWQQEQSAASVLQVTAVSKVPLEGATQETFNKDAETEGQEGQASTESDSASSREAQGSISLEGAVKEADQEKQEQLALPSTSADLQRTALSTMPLTTAKQKVQEWQATYQWPTALQGQELAIGLGEPTVGGSGFVLGEKKGKDKNISYPSTSGFKKPMLKTAVMEEQPFKANKKKKTETRVTHPSTSLVQVRPLSKTLSVVPEEDEMEGEPARISIGHFSGLGAVPKRPHLASAGHVQDIALSPSRPVPQDSAIDGVWVERAAEGYRQGEIPQTSQQGDMGLMLWKAAATGRRNIVRRLVQNDTDLEYTAVDGTTPLHVAALYGHADVVWVLATSGAPLEARDTAGWTPLHSAAQGGWEQIVRALLLAGADIDARDLLDLTPLHYAIFNSHVATIRVLLQAKGLTPEDVADYASPFQ